MSSAGSPRSPPSPATSPTPPTAAHSLAAAGERIDLLVNNASVLGPSPQPELADYPLEELRARLPRQRAGAARADPARAAAAAATAAAILNITSDAAVEPYEGWGGYGSSKAALEQLTAILAAEQPAAPRLRRRPRRHAHRRCTRTAFPGEDISDRPPPEDSVPGLLALIEGDARRAAATARSALVRRMSAPSPSSCRRRSRPASRPRRAALHRDEVRLLVAAAPRMRSTTARSAICPSCSNRATCSWSTSRRPFPPRSPAAAPTAAPVRVHFATRGARAWPGWRVVELRIADGELPACARSQVSGSSSRAALRCSSSRRMRRDARLLLAQLRAGPNRLSEYLARHGEPIRYGYVRATLAASAPTRPSTRRLRAAPRCRARAVRSRAELITELVARGVLFAPLTLHTGVSRRSTTSRRSRSSSRSREATARLVNARRWRRPGDRGRHDSRARAGDGRAGRTVASAPERLDGAS